MKILITNDDGYFAPGLQALAEELARHAEIFIVAPSIEQSGISQAITFLRPLNPKPVPQSHDQPQDTLEGYLVNGTPADCVKLAIHELCPFKPDVVISGINCGLNVGINVCHSGTVGGAFAASMFGFRSIAVSVESSDDPDFQTVASLTWPIIEPLLHSTFPPRTVLNLNFPNAAIDAANNGTAPTVVSVPVETNPLGYHFQQGRCPKNQPYYWATNQPPPTPSPGLTDTQATMQGLVTLSALAYDPNHSEAAKVLDGMFASAAGEKQ